MLETIERTWCGVLAGKKSENPKEVCYMHLPSPYEVYLREERARCKYTKNKWLELESETYRWIFDLEREVCWVGRNRTVPKRLMKQMESIPTIRFLRYRDISPVLKEAIKRIASEFASLNEDLKNPEMWRNPSALSGKGLRRWEQTVQILYECRYVTPDPEWRLNWENEKRSANDVHEEKDVSSALNEAVSEE